MTRAKCLGAKHTGHEKTLRAKRTSREMTRNLRWTASSLETFESVNGHQTVEQYSN